MAAVRPLIEALREVPEVRAAHGRRHPLGAMLGLACAALLCGARTDEAIAAWGRNYDSALLRALGFTHPKTPCAATLFWLFRRLERAKLEAVLGRGPSRCWPPRPPPTGSRKGLRSTARR